MAITAFVTQPTDGWIGRWSPGIGDASLVGWFTVLLYLACAWLCWRTGRQLRSPAPIVVREKRLWNGLAVGFAALGINKQLDLQTAVTELGRTIAFRQGWYERRGDVQVLFILLIALVAVAVAVAVLWSMWRAPGWSRVSVLGTTMVLAFVVMRAASFHHVDRLLGSTLFGVRFNWAIEITGIITVMIGAWMRRRNATMRPHPRRAGRGGASR